MKVITMRGSEQYELGRNGSYTVRDYLNAKPFSSFLSGLAGIWGKPMWAHYVNRGQAIACFGIQDKNMAFLEFQSARLHQTRNALEGFRTFLRLSRKNSPTIVYEPFRQHAPDAGIEQVLTVFPLRSRTPGNKPLPRHRSVRGLLHARIGLHSGPPAQGPDPQPGRRPA